MRDVTSSTGRGAESRPWWAWQPIAHRGLHDEQRPENSLAAVEAAVASGFAVEIDVRLTSDGWPVAFHDASLARMTGHEGLLEQHTKEQVCALKLAGSDQHVPGLVEILEGVAGRVPILVEIKNDARPGLLEHAVCEVLQDYVGPCAVQSFNPWVVAWFRWRRPDVPRGLLASDFSDVSLSWHRRFVLKRLLTVPLCRPHFIGYDVRALPYWAPRMARAAGLPLLAWTVRTPEQLQRARRLADNVIFEGEAVRALL